MRDEVQIARSNDCYVLDMDTNGAVAITQKNCRFIEAIIGLDSAYALSEQGKEGSARGLLLKNKEIIFENRDILQSYIDILDNENSTHLSVVDGGREFMANVLFEEMNNQEGFLGQLGQGDSELVERIARKSRDGKMRNNFSFATKFCTYFARDYFEDADKQDAYCVYDSFVANVLPYYIWLYETSDKPRSYVARVNSKIPTLVKEQINYKLYKELIDDIRKAAAESDWIPSRKEFDHLLWYYYKSHSDDIKRLIKIVLDNSPVS